MKSISSTAYRLSLILAANGILAFASCHARLTEPAVPSAVEHVTGDVDFAGGPTLTFDLLAPEGNVHTVSIYRSRTPGEYWLLSAPMLVPPAKPASGYPGPIWFGEPSIGTQASPEVNRRHRVELRFELCGPALIMEARRQILAHSSERLYLESRNVNPERGLHILPAPVSAAFIEVQYMGTTVAAGRTSSIVGQSRFALHLDLDDRQLGQIARGTEGGNLAFVSSLRISGKGQGWKWGEMHSQLTVKTAETILTELQKTAEARRMRGVPWPSGGGSSRKDIVFINDVAHANKRFAVAATTLIRTDEASMLPELRPDDFAEVFAEALEAARIESLRSAIPDFDAVLQEYLLPLFEQELTAMGRKDLVESTRKSILEASGQTGGKISIPLISVGGSADLTRSVVQAVEKSSGTTFQHDTSSAHWVPTEVKLENVRRTASMSSVSIYKNIVLEGATAHRWFAQPPVSIRVTAASRAEWLGNREALASARQAAKRTLAETEEGVRTSVSKLEEAEKQEADARKRLETLRHDEAELRSSMAAQTRKLTRIARKVHHPFLAGFSARSMTELSRLGKALKLTKSKLESVIRATPSAKQELAAATQRVGLARTELEKANALRSQAASNPLLHL